MMELSSYKDVNGSYEILEYQFGASLKARFKQAFEIIQKFDFESILGTDTDL